MGARNSGEAGSSSLEEGGHGVQEIPRRAPTQLTPESWGQWKPHAFPEERLSVPLPTRAWLQRETQGSLREGHTGSPAGQQTGLRGSLFPRLPPAGGWSGSGGGALLHLPLQPAHSPEPGVRGSGCSVLVSVSGSSRTQARAGRGKQRPHGDGEDAGESSELLGTLASLPCLLSNPDRCPCKVCSPRPPALDSPWAGGWESLPP